MKVVKVKVILQIVRKVKVVKAIHRNQTAVNQNLHRAIVVRACQVIQARVCPQTQAKACQVEAPSPKAPSLKAIHRRVKVRSASRLKVIVVKACRRILQIQVRAYPQIQARANRHKVIQARANHPKVIQALVKVRNQKVRKAVLALATARKAIQV